MNPGGRDCFVAARLAMTSHLLRQLRLRPTFVIIVPSAKIFALVTGRIPFFNVGVTGAPASLQLADLRD